MEPLTVPFLGPRVGTCVRSVCEVYAVRQKNIDGIPEIIDCYLGACWTLTEFVRLVDVLYDS